MTKQKYHPHRYAWLTLALVLPILLLSACGGASKRLTKDLPEDDRHFLSKVRYIITRSEKKKFLHLVNSGDRAQFRAEFWKKRDPNKSTQINEFRNQYFQRIEEANHLFSETGRGRGWLSDRGRVHIMLGPPEVKQVYPTGYDSNSRPSEVWIYGFFPIIFVDRTMSGAYELTTLGAWHVAEIVKARKKEVPTVAKVQSPFGFSLKIWKDKQNNLHNLQIVMPYRNVIFEEGNDGYKADLNVQVNLVETKTKVSQTMNKPHTIFVKSGELDKLQKNHVFTVPLKLEPGKYEAVVVVENKADNVNVKDRISFNIK
ncbi:MAG: GWxTD domain-containing protein [bacterium]|nr:GWxTD domain-containing protein [bacterium]